MWKTRLVKQSSSCTNRVLLCNCLQVT